MLSTRRTQPRAPSQNAVMGEAAEPLTEDEARAKMTLFDEAARAMPVGVERGAVPWIPHTNITEPRLAGTESWRLRGAWGRNEGIQR